MYGSGGGYGMYGLSSGGFGVAGGSGSGFGVYGTSTSGDGVLGESFTHGNGVLGLSSSGDGVYGESHSSTGVYAISFGQTRDHPALRAQNVNDDRGMAAYMTNNSNFATAHFANAGNGQVLYLQANGGPFIQAINNAENDTKFIVDYNGNVTADGSFTSPAADFAEMLSANDGLQAGDVLIIGTDGKLTRSTRTRQASVVGVYSTQPGFVGGKQAGGAASEKIPLAVVGIVPVKVTTEGGAIHPGDLLTTSSTAGHAMKAGRRPKVGTVIGKALSTLERGSGVIQMLAMLQ